MQQDLYLNGRTPTTTKTKIAESLTPTVLSAKHRGTIGLNIQQRQQLQQHSCSRSEENG